MPWLHERHKSHQVYKRWLAAKEELDKDIANKTFYFKNLNRQGATEALQKTTPSQACLQLNANNAKQADVVDSAKPKNGSLQANNEIYSEMQAGNISVYNPAEKNQNNLQEEVEMYATNNQAHAFNFAASKDQDQQIFSGLTTKKVHMNLQEKMETNDSSNQALDLDVAENEVREQEILSGHTTEEGQSNLQEGMETHDSSKQAQALGVAESEDQEQETFRDSGEMTRTQHYEGNESNRMYIGIEPINEGQHFYCHICNLKIRI